LHLRISWSDSKAFTKYRVANFYWLQLGKNKRIRRISIDKFYEIITCDKNAFYKLCIILPDLIKEIMNDVKFINQQKDSVFEELVKIQKDKNISFEMSLCLLGFYEYNGFIK